MKKILCFGEVCEKHEKAIKNAMRECENIVEWDHAPNGDELPNTDDEFILMKCDIHSDDFLRHIIAINKKQKCGRKILSDALRGNV
ncbi:MAG: hypothetical protein IKM94_00770 [Alphaproteobacteria bacterium]|nr:hypothetical protein [Alphaproteobacteria bacterium]